MASEQEISKTLIKILRYDASKYGLKQDSAGWVEMEELLTKCRVPGSLEDILSVAVTSTGKQGKRFEVDMPEGGSIRLRATYTHGKPSLKKENSSWNRDLAPRQESHHVWKMKASMDCRNNKCMSSAESSCDAWKASTPDGTATLAGDDAETSEVSQETWQKFRDPSSQRLWLCNSQTEEFFFEDVAQKHGWTKYESAQGPWWFHAASRRFFFDPAFD